MAESWKQLVKRNLWTENQVVRQILGICSSLAVTNLMANSLVMGLGLTFVTALSGLTLSLLRNLIPRRIRMIVQTLVIAAYVILVDLIIKAALPDISKALGAYVALIITNCIIMGRAEAFAIKNPPVPAFLDGVGAGLGYSGVLMAIACVREPLGFGSLFGIPLPAREAWFHPVTIMVMPPGAFFMLALVSWLGISLTARRPAGPPKGAAK